MRISDWSSDVCSSDLASDEDYRSAVAEIMTSASVIFEQAEMIVKVMEPPAEERPLLREGQILFTYLYLATDPAQTKDLNTSAAVCIAYETLTTTLRWLPLLDLTTVVSGKSMAVRVAHGG